MRWRWPPTELDAAFAHMRVVAVAALRVGQGLDEGMRLGALGGVHHLGLAGVGATVDDVVAHRAVQQRGVLRDHADLRAQLSWVTPAMSWPSIRMRPAARS
jgi:hypothetical protein